MIEGMTLKKYIEYRESLDKEKLKEEKKDKIIDEIDIIIENKIKNLEKIIKEDDKISYNYEDEETSLHE